MDGRAWWATVHGVAKSPTRLSDFPFHFHWIMNAWISTLLQVVGWGGVSLNLLSGIRWLNQGTQQQQKPCVFPPREGLLSQT